MVDAVVLAGSPNNGPRRNAVLRHEALIPLGAKQW